MRRERDKEKEPKKVPESTRRLAAWKYGKNIRLTVKPGQLPADRT
jgi:hypothetical protein